LLNLQKIDHVGIRVRVKARAVSFYELLGFEVKNHEMAEQGLPVIMQHPCGAVINLLISANRDDGPNVLMDVEAKHPGYTHVALQVDSLRETEAFLSEHGIEITGRLSFADLRAVFIRDPDRNVIELDDYPDPQPSFR